MKKKINDLITAFSITFITTLAFATTSYGYSDITPDGKIGDFKQGQIGDCWFLSGIYAANQDVTGHFIIGNAITKINSNTWHVSLPGIEADVTQEELSNYEIDGNKISDGDADVRLLEIAAYEKGNLRNSSMTEGGKVRRAFSLLNGKPNLGTMRGVVKKFIKRRLKRDYKRHYKDGLSWAFGADKGNALGYPGDHAGAIVDMNWYREGKETFRYVNPWDTSIILEDTVDNLVKGIDEKKIRLYYGNFGKY